jgi:hypothetical protein
MHFIDIFVWTYMITVFPLFLFTGRFDSEFFWFGLLLATAWGLLRYRIWRQSRGQ